MSVVAKRRPCAQCNYFESASMFKAVTGVLSGDGDGFTLFGVQIPAGGYTYQVALCAACAEDAKLEINQQLAADEMRHHAASRAT